MICKFLHTCNQKYVPIILYTKYKKKIVNTSNLAYLEHPFIFICENTFKILFYFFFCAIKIITQIYKKKKCILDILKRSITIWTYDFFSKIYITHSLCIQI